MFKKIIQENDYVTLHCHSEFSPLDGFARIDDFLDPEVECSCAPTMVGKNSYHKASCAKVIMQGITSRLVEIGHTHCAITDHASVSGIQPAYNSFKKAGIQLIPGCEFYVVPDMQNTGKEFRNHLVVMARNKKGYENILKMNYLAYDKGARMVYDRQVGRISMDVLEKHKEGLLISSACLAGVPSWALMNNNKDIAVDHIKHMYNMFGENYFLEIQAVDYYNQLDASAKTSLVDKEWIELQAKEQKRVNDMYAEFGSKFGPKIVVTTDAHYTTPADRESHLLMLAVQSKKNIQQPSFMVAGKGGRLAFEATPMLSTEELVETMTETESGYNGYDESLVREWIGNTRLAIDICEPPDYLESTGYKIPLFPIDQTDDYQDFVRWKNTLEQEQIDSIVKSESDYLQSRLIKDGQ